MFRLGLLFFLCIHLSQAALSGTIYANTQQHRQDLSFKHLGGGTSYLHDFKGKFLIVHLWATWCGSCMQEMDSLRELNAKLKGSNARLLMVSTDFGGEAWLKSFIQHHKMEDFDVVLEPSLGRYFQVKAIPTTIFINSMGVEVGRIVGSVRWQSDEIQNYLKGLMEESQNTYQKKE